MPDLHVFILLWSQWVFYCGVSGRITDLYSERELLSFKVQLCMLEEHLKFLVVLRLMYSSQGLMEVELIVGPQYQPLNSIDLCLAIGRNLQIDFLEPDD